MKDQWKVDMENTDELITALGQIKDFLVQKELADLKYIVPVYDDASNLISLELHLPVLQYPYLDELLDEIKKVLAGYQKDLTPVVVEMDKEEISAFSTELKKDNMFSPGSGKAPVATQVIAVASGKGGVGKSSVTVNLAAALSLEGKSVAILDADIYGFSIPRMLGVNYSPIVVEGLVIAPITHGVRCISMGFFVEEDVAIAWRGPMLHKTLEQFITEVYFGNIDYLLVDMPPGTGDVALSMSQHLGSMETVIVTTPQLSAQKVAQRAGALANQLKMPIRGIIENMSYFEADDAKKYEIFGAGGGQALAEKFDVPLLAQIPIVISAEMGLDRGCPAVICNPESEVAVIYRALAKSFLEMKPRKIYKGELKIN